MLNYHSVLFQNIAFLICRLSDKSNLVLILATKNGLDAVTLKEIMLNLLNILQFENMTIIICALNKFLVSKDTVVLHQW